MSYSMHAVDIAIRKQQVGRKQLLLDIVGSDRDPLLTCIDAANNEDLPITVRLMAASISLPYLRPRLSAVAISRMPTAPSDDARRTVTELIDRLAAVPPQAPLIEHAPVDEPKPDAEVVPLRRSD